ncbi:uncharacterized protein YhjY with autotransporter beta-barrel domain [Brevundimonas sp. SORGH_AS 993]|nr:uncharacterized protein YhjY with autotransporter beta-barrel domain [Brevundimonas sp. SORGH_AS_0993]
MDLFKVGDTLAANPGAFGVTNITQPCFNGATVCSNPDSYFYFDGVHPTAAGHRIIAQLANDYLYYGDLGAQTALQGETTYRHREDGLDAAAEALSGRTPWEAGVSVTTAALVDSVDTDARGPVTSSSSDGWGARIALEAGPSANWRFGLAGTARKTDVQSRNLNFNVESFGLDVYGGWRSGDVFVNAAAGVARDNVDDIERITSLAPIVHTAETRALSTGARLQGGMWFDWGGFALSPRAALAYVASDVDGYVEQGVAAQYQYGDRTVKALTGEVSLRAEAEMGGFNLFAEGGYRDALDDSSDPGPRRHLQQPGPGPVARGRRSVRRSDSGLGRGRGRRGAGPDHHRLSRPFRRPRRQPHGRRPATSAAVRKTGGEGGFQRPFFRTHMAASASVSQISGSVWPSQARTPNDPPSGARSPSQTNPSEARASDNWRALARPSSSPAFSISRANSSPPIRPTASDSRRCVSNRRATVTRAASPAAWPRRSLTPLNPSMSRYSRTAGTSCRWQ